MAAKVGMFGGTGGTSRDIDQDPINLSTITVWSTSGPQGKINALKFTYEDKNGNAVVKGPWGKQAGETDTISLAGEYVIEVFGTSKGGYITSIGFKTSQGTVYSYGMFPTDTVEEKFRIPVMKSKTVAFFGRADNYGLCAIGTYVAPMTKAEANRMMLRTA